jgi:CubicO group peptidase (beta-lactamase class C family)
MSSNLPMASRIFSIVSAAVLMSLLAGASSNATAQGATQKQDSTRISRKVDALIAAFSRPVPFNGIVLVARGQRIIAERSYGWADVDRRIPNTPSTRFRIGSATKPMTAEAIMLLQDAGKLNVNDHVCLYVAACPASWQPITLRNLLTHTAGLPNYTSFTTYRALQARSTSPAAILASFRDSALEFVPGSKYDYGNSAYALLGAVIERVSGQSYGAYITARIFKPLRMNSTAYAPRAVEMSREYAKGFVWDGKLVPAETLDLTNFYASGGVVTTAEDLWRFARGFEQGRLLSLAARREMEAPGINDYGYGWMIGNQYGHRTISHPGTLPGFRSSMVIFPDDSLFVIALSNVQDTEAGVVTQFLAATALGISVDLKDLPPLMSAGEAKPLSVPSSVLQRYIGRYEPPMGMITVIARGDSLFGEFPGAGEEVPLIPISASEFLVRGPGNVRLEFVVGTDGRVTRMNVLSRGKVFVGPKLP